MKRLDQVGYTLIEALIVLAVAGVIFSIVFVSIPVLIRNGHNNQRKQDVTTVLSAISQYQLSHSGTNFPTTSMTCGAACVDSLLQYSKLSFYKKTDIKVHVESAGATAVTTVDPEEVHIYNYHLCAPSNDGIISGGAGYRDITALYAIETSGVPGVKCQQL